MCLIRLLFCYCKLITIALIVATSVYFQVVDDIVNKKLTDVIDEIDTIEKKHKNLKANFQIFDKISEKWTYL